MHIIKSAYIAFKNNPRVICIDSNVKQIMNGNRKNKFKLI